MREYWIENEGQRQENTEKRNKRMEEIEENRGKIMEEREIV